MPDDAGRDARRYVSESLGTFALVAIGPGAAADFGIALALSGSDGERLTGTGLSLGTPAGTRAEIDTTRLAYIGLSLGAGSRLPLAAVDDRFRAVVLVGAGIDERLQPTLPEAANFDFAPRIRVPKLVLNGRQDEEHPWATRGLPLWNLLREPKELVLIEGVGHHPPIELRAPAVNAFVDRVLGPVAAAAPR